MAALLEIGHTHDISVVEDAAEAIGSIYQGRRAGSMGQFGTFSFHGSKTITTGEGGMFVTADPELYERVLTLSNHGRSRSETRQFWPEMVGFKYKISNLQAAIGCAQTERIETLIGRKRAIMAEYRSALGDMAGLSLNPEPNGVTIGAWMPTVVFAADLGLTTQRVTAALQANNIDARIFFEPLSSTPNFETMRRNTVAYDLAERAVNLPSYHDMSSDDIQRVCEVIRRLVRSS